MKEMIEIFLQDLFAVEKLDEILSKLRYICGGKGKPLKLFIRKYEWVDMSTNLTASNNNNNNTNNTNNNNFSTTGHGGNGGNQKKGIEKTFVKMLYVEDVFRSTSSLRFESIPANYATFPVNYKKILLSALEPGIRMVDLTSKLPLIQLSSTYALEGQSFTYHSIEISLYRMVSGNFTDRNMNENHNVPNDWMIRLTCCSSEEKISNEIPALLKLAGYFSPLLSFKAIHYAELT